MKHLPVFLLILLTSFTASAQSHVFVLVDASKSVKQSQLNDAREALTEVLTGATPSKAFISQGKVQDLAGFKVKPGDKLSVCRFGSLSTTLAINPNPVNIQNIAGDVSQAVNSIAWTPTDNQTYITLAKAKIAEYAKNHQISRYRLYLISDNIQDDYGPGGKPNYSDDYTRNLVEGYNTSTNPVSEAGYTKLKFSQNSDFTLSFSPSVDVSKYSLPPGKSPPVSVPDATPEPASITLTAFADGRKDKPKEAKSGDVTLSWTCNCPEGTKFNALITAADGSKYKDQKKNISGNSVKFADVPGGTFKVVVSATDVNSASTYIKTPSGSMAWLIILVLILAGGGVAYYVYYTKRNKKLAEAPVARNEGMFSNTQQNTSSHSGSSNNSTGDYF